MDQRKIETCLACGCASIEVIELKRKRKEELGFSYHDLVTEERLVLLFQMIYVLKLENENKSESD